MKSSTQPPICSVCGNRHRLGAPHVWSNKGVSKPAKKPVSPKNVATKRQKRQKKPNVATIRQVGIRELNKGISKHFKDLPFEVTKRGLVIARVDIAW